MQQQQPNNNARPNGHHTSGAPSPLREKVQFAANLPTFVTLDSAGELQEGRFGDQYRYFLGGNKIMWVEPAVHELIVRSGAQERDEVCITKREVKEGRRKSLVWDVELVVEEPDFARPPRNEAEAEAAAEARTAGAARRTVEGVPTPAARPAPGPQPMPAERPQPAARPATPMSLAEALMLAIDAVERAEEHAAKAHGWDGAGLADADHIVKLAITAYIQACGGKQARP